MRLLLCSDFTNIGYKFFDRFKFNAQNKNCLFVGYAQEDEDEINSSSALRLKEMGFNLIF